MVSLPTFLLAASCTAADNHMQAVILPAVHAAKTKYQRGKPAQEASSNLHLGDHGRMYSGGFGAGMMEQEI